MYEIFMECITIIKNYIGFGYLFYLYLAALIYLFFTEKEKRLRALIIYTPLTILIAFIFPVTRWLYINIGLDQETYYRLIWLIPIGITIAYSACKLFVAHRRIGLIATSIIIIITGVFVYNSPHITKAENLYNLSGATINVVDFILEDAEFDYIYAVFPKEHIENVRQYTSHIKLAYGREMLVPRWGFSNPIYDVMEKHDIIDGTIDDIIDIPSLLELTRPKLINYIIIHGTRITNENPENYGLLLLDQIDGLLIYRDEVVAQEVRESFGPLFPKKH